MNDPLSGVGCVAIGRNEGPQLSICLTRMLSKAAKLVYVDSGSTDDSVARAREMGVAVVELDQSAPYTAARARNAGLAALAGVMPDLAFVQFVDGDCELAEGWLERAHTRLLEQPKLAAVCGRIRERNRDQTVYNRLADIEWGDAPVGEVPTSGGNVMVRRAAFEQVGGFNPILIAGEEAELCLRLRRRGHTVERLPHDMVLHDMAMSRFSQWWKRSTRTGHSYAEAAHLHGDGPERHKVRECRRALLWGAALPGFALGAALPTLGTSTLLLLSYPLSAARVYRRLRRDGVSADDAALYGAFVTVSKFAEAQGVLRFHLGRLTGRRSGLIEHKGPR